MWPFAAWAAARLLITEAPLAKADAIVVLGGSANYRERAREAARLLREGRAPVILLTNDNQRGPWSSAEQRNLYFYERSLEEIHNAGAPCCVSIQAAATFTIHIPMLETSHISQTARNAVNASEDQGRNGRMGGRSIVLITGLPELQKKGHPRGCRKGTGIDPPWRTSEGCGCNYSLTSETPVFS